MVSKYWVGGTGNWSDTAHWSASSGGAGGATVPTGGANVFIDNGSDVLGAAFQINLDVNTATLNNITLSCTDATFTIACFGYTLRNNGTYTQSAGTVAVTAASTVRISNVALSGGQLGTANMGYALKIENSFNQSGGTFFQPTSAGSFTIYGSGWTYTAGTCTYYTGYVEVIGTAAFAIVSASRNIFYRLKNSLTGGAGISIETGDLDIDGIWFKAGYPITVDTITLTVTGITPCLGSSPLSRAELIAAGQLVETDGGLAVFDHEPSPDTGTGGWRVLRGTTQEEQNNIMQVKFTDTMDRYSRMAEVDIDDPAGTEASNYTELDPLEIYYHDGTEWIRRFRTPVQDISDDVKGSPYTIIKTLGMDTYLRKRKISLNMSYVTHTLSACLKAIITTYTPCGWDAGKIDLFSDPVVASPIFDGVTPDEAIGHLLEQSASEEYFIDDDFEFNVRQRATAYGGTYDSPVTYDDDNITEISLETIGSEQVNRVTVKYGTNLDNMVVAEDTAKQLTLQTQSGASNPVVIEMEYSRSDITSQAQALDYARYKLYTKRTRLQGVLTTYDSRNVYPGMITQVTVSYKSGYTAPVDFKIIAIEYDMNADTTILTIAEPDVPPKLTLSPAHTWQGAANEANLANIQRASDSVFNMQRKYWDTQADFNLWTLGANEAVHAAGYIYCTGATVGVERCTSPWIIPGTGKDAVLWWWILNFILANNGGLIVVLVEGSTTGTIIFTDDWSLLRSSFLPGENLRICIDVVWGGAGGSPTFDYGAIGWK